MGRLAFERARRLFSQIAYVLRLPFANLSNFKYAALIPGWTSITRESGERFALCRLPYLAPAPGAVVGHHRSDEINKCLLVDALVFVKLNASRRGIVLALIYQSSWVGRDGVVNKHINVVFGG